MRAQKRAFNLPRLKSHLYDIPSPVFICISTYIEIIPSTLAMELHRMIIKHIGARYFRKNWYSFFLRMEDDCSISSAIRLKPTTRSTKKQVVKAASGIITEFVMKSKKSRNAIPNILTKSSAPYPREEAEPKTNITIAIRAQHFGRLQ